MAGMNGSRKDTLNTIVGEGSVLEGNVQVRENIRVDGSLVGRLTSSGTLEVSPSGVVAAEHIKVKRVIWNGLKSIVCKINIFTLHSQVI